MRKFFILTDECEYKKDYLNYMENAKIVNELVKEFFRDKGVETKEYYIDSNQLYIIPTEKDEDKFDKYLNKPIEQGLRAFKKNSKMNKDFMQFFKDRNVEILKNPILIMYLSFTGKVRTTTFLKGDTMYAEIEAEKAFNSDVKGFIEIKASEYYLAVEDEQ